MRRHVVSLSIGIGIFVLHCHSVKSQVFWINEFHYDNAGTDVGEFVEIVAPANFTDLSQVRLTLYNGGDGAPYGAAHLLSSFTQGEEVSGLRFYSKSISGLQNGAPDGLALDVSGSVVQFLSYEGGFTASSGPASGLNSRDVGHSETEATPTGVSLGLIGNGQFASDFTWTTFASGSPGLLNPGQAVVPEPAHFAVAAAGALAVYAFFFRKRSAVDRPGSTLPTRGEGAIHVRKTPDGLERMRDE